jgi:hypothetical protein
VQFVCSSSSSFFVGSVPGKHGESFFHTQTF